MDFSSCPAPLNSTVAIESTRSPRGEYPADAAESSGISHGCLNLAERRVQRRHPVAYEFGAFRLEPSEQRLV